MSHPGRGRMAFALALLISFASSGCGQKGPLFLPGTNGAASAAAGTAAAGSASAAAR